MARIVLGHRDGALATRQARTVLSELAAEWPDVQIVLRQVASKGSDDPLLAALQAGSIGIALSGVDNLPTHLPDGLTLAAVGRRLEPRMALVSRGRSLAQLASARVRVVSERDLAFLRATLPNANGAIWRGTVDAALAGLIADDYDALLLPGALLIALDYRERINSLLDADVFPPAPGQGALGLVVRSEDDAAAELAYTLQHRPSFARVRAERAFAAGVGALPVGALASVDDEGDLQLFGVVVTADGALLQASSSGDASDALEVGSELASDVRQRLA